MHLLFLSSAREPDTVSHPRVLILAGRDSQASVVETHAGLGSRMYWSNGVTEIVAGAMLAIPPLSRWGAWFIIAHLVAFFSVHFWMIQEKERYLSDDVTIGLLWLRIVFQVLFIVWAYWFTTGPGTRKRSP